MHEKLFNSVSFRVKVSEQLSQVVKGSPLLYLQNQLFILIARICSFIRPKLQWSGNTDTNSELHSFAICNRNELAIHFVRMGGKPTSRWSVPNLQLHTHSEVCPIENRNRFLKILFLLCASTSLRQLTDIGQAGKGVVILSFLAQEFLS